MFGDLLKNRYMLYGGAALGVLAVVYLMSGSGASADDEGGDMSGGLYPAAYAPVAIPTSAQGSSGGGMDLGALIALESKKADYGREVSLAEIDATLKTNIATTAANLSLGLAQADALNLMSFADIFGSASKLYLANTNAVGGAFTYGGKTFDFSTYRVAGSQTNQIAADAMAAFRNAALKPTGTPNAGSSSTVASNAGQLPVTSAPSSRTAGAAGGAVAPVAQPVAPLAQAVTSLGSLVASSQNRLGVADRLRL